MTEPIKLLVDYANWLADLKLRIQSAQLRSPDAMQWNPGGFALYRHTGLHRYPRTPLRCIRATVATVAVLHPGYEFAFIRGNWK